MKHIALIIFCYSLVLNAQGITNTLGGNSAAEKFIIENSDANPGLVVTGEGNVGIGTTSPVSKLSVEGGSVNVNNSNWSRKAVLGSPGDGVYGSGSSRGGYFITDGSAGAYGLMALDGGAAGAAKFLGDVYIMPNQSGINGHVGMGTDSPTAKLHLYANDSSPLVLRIDNANTSSSSKLYFDALNNAGISVFGSSYSGSTNVMRIFNNRKTPDGTIDFVLNGGIKVMIDEQGNVGIGETNMNNKLEVNGKITIGNDGATPKEGTIRYYNGHFEGYNGSTWLRLDN